jgi:hypothetical protein
MLDQAVTLGWGSDTITKVRFWEFWPVKIFENFVNALEAG